MNQAGIFPGQAVLMSNVMSVFTLTGDAMVNRGNFFATMFIVLASGCLVFYAALGYSTNTVAQVSSLIFEGLDLYMLISFVAFEPQDSETNFAEYAAAGYPVLRSV
jgi:hypothetical protein